MSQRFPFRAVVTITENAGSGAAARITAWARARFTAETVGGVTVHDLTPGPLSTGRGVRHTLPGTRPA